MIEKKSAKGTLLTFMAFFLILALVSIFSSSRPDGLENVLQQFNEVQSSGHDFWGPFNDYTIHNDFSPRFNQFLSALLGMGIILTGLMLSKRILSLKIKKDESSDAT